MAAYITHHCHIGDPIDLYNTHHSKIWENWRKNLGKGGKVDFNEGGGCAIYPYNTHQPLIRAHQ